MLMTHVTMGCDADEAFQQLKDVGAALLDLVRAEPGRLAAHFAVDGLAAQSS